VTVYAVWDNTTANLLGEFDTQAEAEAWIEKIRPFGRFGPDGHDLVVTEEETDDV